MLTAEQLAERHSGLGGSDAAPALALSPFKSPLALFLEKRGKVDTVETLAAFEWGNRLEPVIRQAYSDKTGRVVRMPTGTLRHPEHPFMIAHLDGVTDDRRVFEAKTSRIGDGWGKSGTDEVPHWYLLQCQHYLSITGFEVADVAVLIGGSDFRVYEVPADRDLQNDIITGEAEFWSLVVANTPPPPEWDVDSVEIMARLFRETNGDTVIADEEDRQWQQVFARATELAKSYEATAAGAKTHLLHKMGNSSRMIFAAAELQLTRKLVERKAYSVGATKFLDSRFVKLRETE